MEAARPAAAPAGPGCSGAPRVEGADAAEVIGEEGRVPLVEDAVGAREDVVQLPLRVPDQLVHKLCKRYRKDGRSANNGSSKLEIGWKVFRFSAFIPERFKSSFGVGQRRPETMVTPLVARYLPSATLSGGPTPQALPPSLPLRSGGSA